MRHAKRRLQLNRFTSWHKATLNSMARNLLMQQRIHTTLDRAKAARQLIEKLISLAKSNTLAAKRRAFKVLGDHKLVSLLFKEIGPRFQNRKGGYTRIIHLSARRGDNAQLALLELTEIKEKEAKKPKKEKETKPEHEPQAKPETKKETQPEARPEAVKEKERHTKPTKKFMGGFKNIFKKERDSL